MRILSGSDVEHFIEYGWVKLPEAYSPEDALAVQKAIWRRLEERGVDESDPSTWNAPSVHLRESYRGPEFDRCDTKRLQAAISDLVGQGRLLNPGHPSWGWWPVNFSVGAELPWTVPDRGWHWDGHHFRHFVDSPDQGLLTLCVFSEIGPGGGGTLLAEGSHRIVARLLEDHRDGIDLVDAIAELNRTHRWFGALTASGDASCNGQASPEGIARARVARFMENVEHDDTGQALKVVELTANPGDVYLCHPFLYHAASQNHSGRPRFLCNRIGTLKSPMRIHGPADDLSPVEISIRQALARHRL